MAKALKLFKEDSSQYVKRFYHLDYYYYLLFLIKTGCTTFDEIFRAVFQFQNELFELSTAVGSLEKFKTEYQIKSTLEECIQFQLIKTKNGKTELTEEGTLLLTEIINKKFESVEKVLCQKMEERYGRPSQLIKLFKAINPESGLIVFPKTSPRTFDMSPTDLFDKNKVEEFSSKSAQHVSKEIKKTMNLEISEVPIKEHLQNGLSNYLTHASERPMSLNISREVKTLLFNYYLNLFWPQTFELTTFNIWIRRAKELKLLNFTEFFPGANSLIIYPISIIMQKEVTSLEFITMATTRSGDFLMRYEPHWESRRELFITALWNNYIELSRNENSFFIPVQDLRDIVCFKLQMSEQTFANFLGYAYNESINDIIKKIKISLEVDRSPKERVFVNSKRYPILINNVPKNIIGIKMN